MVGDDIDEQKCGY
ncbi:hypothetical protein YPPY47_2474, partial [Yersinia pestis PY-47]